MKGHIKAFVIVFLILITYTILVYAYAESKKGKTEEPKDIDKVVNPEPKPDEPEKITNFDFNMLLTPKTIVGYTNGKWYENESFEYENKYFDIYAGENYKSKRLVYTDRWYIMNDDKTFVDYSGNFAAIISSIPYTYIEGISANLSPTNDGVIKAFLDAQNVKYNYDNLHKSVMSYDVNNDGIRDEVYVISNLFLDDYVGFDSTFAYVFVRMLNQNIIIWQDTFQEAGAVSICNPKLDGILIIDDYPQMIFECAYYSERGTKHMIFKMDGKKAEKLLDTKAN